MDYDVNELIAVRESEHYKKQIARICAPCIQKIVDDELIEFYGSEKRGNNDKYGKWLSNCFIARVEIDGELNRSSEHYYQREKFRIDATDPHVIEWCKLRRVPVELQLNINKAYREQMATVSPVIVARQGRTKSVVIRGDWESVKNAVMWRALVAKFTQNAEFAAALKSTGTRVLIERSPNDRYWAIDNRGVGANTLGIMLMVIRSFLE